MTDEKIILFIAEKCGWTCSDVGWWSHPTLPDNGGAEPNPPEYTRDLNAMFLAEEMLDEKQRERYAAILYRIAGNQFDAINSPAHLRATAFVSVCKESSKD